MIRFISIPTFLFVCVFVIQIGSSAARADEEIVEDTEKQSDTATTVSQNSSPSKTIRVRDNLSSGDYTLQIEDEFYPVENGEISSLEFHPNRFVSVKLRDKFGRVVGMDRAFWDEDVVSEISARNNRVGTILIASSGFVVGKPADILVKNTGSFTSVFFNHQRDLIGLWAQLGSANFKEVATTPPLGVNLSMSFLDLGLSHDFIPFRKEAATDLIVGPIAGVSLMSANFAVKDDFENFTDSSSGVGFYAGGYLRYPIVANFWLDGTWVYRAAKIKFKTFDYDRLIILQCIGIGGSYAF